MALQASASVGDPLRFSEIKTEFAATATNLRAYLKGQGIVDSNDIAPNVPSTGTISILNFLGAARVDLVVNLPQWNPANGVDVVLVSETVIDDPAQTAWAAGYVYLYANGSGFYRTSNYTDGPISSNFQWLTSGSASDAYAWLDTPTGNNVYANSSSAVATLLQLNATRDWEWCVQTPSYNSGVSLASYTTLRIKNSSNTDLDTVTIDVTLSAINGVLP